MLITYQLIAHATGIRGIVQLDNPSSNLGYINHAVEI